MTDKTKQLFNAPWTIEEEAPLAWYCVIDSKDSVVANDARDQKTVNRLARLPELYDALIEAAGRVCFCCTEDRTGGVVQPSAEWFMDNPEFCSVKDCKYKHWWYLLRKVRNGE